MATKAQKRAVNKAKYEAFMQDLKDSGLRALKNDRHARHQKALAEWEDNHNKRHTSDDKLIVECPHCQIRLRELGLFPPKKGKKK